MPEQSDGPDEKEPIFYDPSRRRARAVSWVIAVAVVAVVVWVGLFWFSIFVLGKLTELDAKASTVAEVSDAAITLRSESVLDRPTEDFVCTGEPVEGDLLAPRTLARPDIVLQHWPEAAIPVMAENCSGLASIYVEWFRIDAMRADVIRTVPDFITDAALRASMGPAGREVALKVIVELPLPPLPGPVGLNVAEVRQTIVEKLTRIAAANAYSELCLKPDGFRAWHLAGLTAFLPELDEKLSGAGITTCLVAEAAGPFWRDRDIVDSVDTVLLTAFQLPKVGSAPAPLAASDWFDALIPEVLEAMGQGKLRVALGAFGYRWSEGRAPTPVAFAEAMRLAAKFQGEIDFPEELGNTHVAFKGADGRANDIWLLDTASLWNQLITLERHGIARIALWSAGFEDPGVWQLLNPAGPALATEHVEDVRLGQYVGYDGEGPFVRLTDLAAAGRRELYRDPKTNRIVGQVYSRVPRPISMERFGRTGEKLIALSFDDGPDGVFTREILDILKDKQVPSAFFVIGRNMAREPELIRRMIEEGHEVGSHTFFHPDTDDIGEIRLAFEVNTVQRLLASITSRSTRLFRPPFGQGRGPATAQEAQATIRLLDEGYLVVGSDIVPRDWEGLSPEAIVDHVMSEVEARPESNVIVMHDAGGDRMATVATVPRLIDALREEGYSFVSLGALLDLDPDQVMPPRQDAISWVDGLSFGLMSGLRTSLFWIFWVAVLGGVLRATLILILALLRRPHATTRENLPGVTVAIPAFNEAAGIESAIASALSSEYPDLKVVVIDDGSEDGTAAIVEGVYGSDPRVTLIQQRNQGKWKALDTAYRYFDTDVIVAVDADTRLQPDAIRLLAEHFRDSTVGAVAGNVKVANRTGLLPRLQSLEYITAQNVDRRAAELLNAMLVVPGAIGAWRAEAVRAAGLYSGSTITEDADLTVAVLRSGYRVRFEPRAVSRTVVPSDMRTFMRQRLRWTFGMMQTAWKHRRAAREGHAVGLVALPDLWLAGVALSLLAPLADLVLIGVLADLAFDAALGRPVLEQETSRAIVGGYLLLPAIDVLAILLALRFERTEPMWLLLLVPFQRIVYRPMLYITVYRAVAQAVRGVRAGWGRPSGAGTSPAPGG